jgi:hypothetical protein
MIAPVVADLFVAGIEDELGDFANRPVPPGVELLVEFACRPAHLGGRYVEAAEFLNRGRVLPGADALDVHLGDGARHRSLAADALLERPRVKPLSVLFTVATGLRYAEGDLADASHESLRLESVGVALTVVGSLMRLGLEGLLSLDLRGVVYERGESGRHGGRTVVEQLAHSQQELAEAQHELAEAKKGTQNVIKDLAKQVGGLAATAGSLPASAKARSSYHHLDARWHQPRDVGGVVCEDPIAADSLGAAHVQGVVNRPT